MFSKPSILISSLFANRLTRQVRELWTSTLILDLAVSMVTIFEPVFLYILFIRFFPLNTTLIFISLFYLAIYVPYFFAVPLGAKFAKRFGYENSIAVASVFFILVYLSLFAARIWPAFIVLAVAAYVCEKTFYWPAFHSNFARFSSVGEQGREISNLWALESAIYILGPLVGGLIIQFYGFKVLFIVVSVLMLSSNIPMLVTREVFEPKKFAYFSAFKSLFDKSNRQHFLGQIGFGEEWIVLVIWPVFMYLVAEDFLGLGLIAAGSTFIATLVLLFIGRWTDKGDKARVLRFGTVFYFFSWLFKILTRSALGVMMIDVYSRVSKSTIALPITAMTYQNAQNSSVTGAIVFFEMSLVLGKIIAILLCILILQIFTPGWNAMFILGGLFTLFYLLFKIK
ncbi:MAG: MFS transporter [Candidatus Buchananbacteria bacterium]